ncbi:hypothetical protein ACO1O0_004503 [Amphichorda felina]
MAVFNPVHALIIPSLCVVTVPLAILAGITTTLAFCVLIIRVLLIYLDIALSIVPQSLSGLTSRILLKPVETPPIPAPKLASPSPLRRQYPSNHHRRRRSSASVLSGSTSSISERGLGLIPSVGPDRDFEGIGGWRVGGTEDDELWTSVSPRLDIPTRHHHHHHRTPSGPTTPGDGGYLMMKGRTRSPADRGAHVRTSTSPNSSRARTPTGPKVAFTGMGISQADGYFALSRNTSPKATKRH